MRITQIYHGASDRGLQIRLSFFFNKNLCSCNFPELINNSLLNPCTAVIRDPLQQTESGDQLILFSFGQPNKNAVSPHPYKTKYYAMDYILQLLEMYCCSRTASVLTGPDLRRCSFLFRRRFGGLIQSHHVLLYDIPRILGNICLFCSTNRCHVVIVW